MGDLYSFDAVGRPQFAMVIELSEAACAVVQHCDEVVVSRMRADGDTCQHRESLSVKKDQLPTIRLK